LILLCVKIFKVYLNIYYYYQKMDINVLHSNLKLNHGSFQEELPEQLITFKYLKGTEKILEIGGNIGRNSLIIASILQKYNNNNFVVLESNYDIFLKLKENRDINNFNFFIENSALSKRQLIQKGIETIPSNIIINGYFPVNIIDYYSLINKYNIDFDTLILDCEGAFFYILLDMPEILNNINLIIMENDYNDINHKIFIDNLLSKNNFYRDYFQSGGWGCCQQFFYEVWKKK